MELAIAFGDKKKSTQVYIKLDAADQLLLSEGVCRLLDIVTYHPAVEKWQGGSKTNELTQTTIDSPAEQAIVPIIKVSAIKSVHILPHQGIVVPVEVTGIENMDTAWLVKPDNIEGVEVEQALLSLHDSKISNVIVSNTQTTEMPVVVQKNHSTGKARLEKIAAQDVGGQKRQLTGLISTK